MTDFLTEIRARLDAATPGPWGSVNGDIIRPLQTVDDGYGCFVVALDCDREADAEFIAHAPADIAWLLDRVEALEIAYRSSVPHFAKGDTDA